MDITCANFPPACIGNLSTIINFIIPFLIFGAALGFLIMLLFGAFTWLTAGGNAENVGKAQKTITFAVLGLLIVVLSFVAVKIIGIITGVGNSVPL